MKCQSSEVRKNRGQISEIRSQRSVYCPEIESRMYENKTGKYH